MDEKTAGGRYPQGQGESRTASRPRGGLDRVVVGAQLLNQLALQRRDAALPLLDTPTGGGPVHRLTRLDALDQHQALLVVHQQRSRRTAHDLACGCAHQVFSSWVRRLGTGQCAVPVVSEVPANAKRRLSWASRDLHIARVLRTPSRPRPTREQPGKA